MLFKATILSDTKAQHVPLGYPQYYFQRLRYGATANIKPSYVPDIIQLCLCSWLRFVQANLDVTIAVYLLGTL